MLLINIIAEYLNDLEYNVKASESWSDPGYYYIVLNNKIILIIENNEIKMMDHPDYTVLNVYDPKSLDKMVRIIDDYWILTT